MPPASATATSLPLLKSERRNASPSSPLHKPATSSGPPCFTAKRLGWTQAALISGSAETVNLPAAFRKSVSLFGSL